MAAGRGAREGSTQPQVPRPHARSETLGVTLEDGERPGDGPAAAIPGREAAARVILPEYYELGEEVARGGLGRILRAWDVRLDRVVAIKELLRAHPAAIARFEREIRITARLQHPNIIPVHEAGAWPSGGLFYAMKLVEGKTLARAAHDAQSFSQRLALLPSVVDVAEAIAYAHSQGIIHRDLKPANVLVGPFGETVVIDWGLAKAIGEPEAVLTDEEEHPSRSLYETRAGAVVGTPAYMPPEQAAGETVEETADVYSLGAVLYHVLSGRSPYAEHAGAQGVSHVLDGPPQKLESLAPEVAPDLLAIVDKAMARAPADRYPTAREMAEELRRFTTGRLVDAYRYTIWDRIRRFVTQHRAAVITAGLAAIALAIFAVTSVARITEERDRAERSAQAEARARQAAERRVDDLLVAKARSLLDHDPTQSVAWLKRLKSIPHGAATVAGRAEDRGVARRILREQRRLVDVVVFSPDGPRVATAGHGKAIHVWNTETGSLVELTGHRERVTGLAFELEGAALLSSSYDGTVRRWSLATHKSEVLAKHAAPVKQFGYAADGMRLASIATDGTIQLWRRNSAERHRWRVPVEREPFLSFSADGHWLVTGSHGSSLSVWDISDEPHRELALSGHEGPVHSAAFAPDSTTVASVGEDGTLRLWSLPKGEARILHRTEGRLQVVAFSPDGHQIACAGMNGNVYLHDLALRMSRVVAKHDERVAALAFSADGQILGSGGWDKMARIHHLKRGTSHVLRGHGDVVASLAFSPTNRTLVTGSWDKTARVWPLAAVERAVLEGHRIGVRSVAYSPDGESIASAGHDNSVRIWNTRTRASRELQGHTDHVYRVLFSPDGTTVASSSDDQTVRVWDLATGDATVLRGHRADVEELAYSPDGRHLASASEDDTARIWDLKAGGEAIVLPHRHDVTAVGFAPNRQVLATASRDRTVRLWDPRNGKPLRTLREHKDEVWALAYSKDGVLASAGADNRVVLWDDNGSFRTLEELPGAQALAFSDDGNRLAVAGSAPTLSLCDLETDTCKALSGHQALVRDILFLPGSDTLVSASGDGTVLVWDIETLERRVLEGHAAPVFDLASSPDARWVASASGDAAVRLWPVEPPPSPHTLRSYLDHLSVETIDDVLIGTPL